MAQGTARQASNAMPTNVKVASTQSLAQSAHRLFNAALLFVKMAYVANRGMESVSMRQTADLTDGA